MIMPRGCSLGARSRDPHQLMRIQKGLEIFMRSDAQRRAPDQREQRKSANFHDASARDLYASQYRAIGIAAVAAGAQQRAVTRAAPSPLDIPAILRFGPETE